jgi:hypothetical protein
MITYEELINQINDAAHEAGLKIYNIRNQLETRTLDREFSFCCVPQEYEAPHKTRALIHFGWDNTLTAESFGGNCALYHGDDIECTHDEIDKEPFIELYIKYQFEVIADFKTMTDEINKELIRIFHVNMEHENVPIIKWELIVRDDGNNMISEISAEHYWHINLMEDYDLESVFTEVKDVIRDIRELPFIKKGF